MNPKICVAIPVKTNKIKDLEPVLNKSYKENPDFIEFRFDYIKSVKHLTDNFLESLFQITKPSIARIFTFRNVFEGGQKKISESNRIEILKLLINSQPEFFDIEINSNDRLLNEIIDLTEENNVDLIFSNHNFQNTPSYGKAYGVVMDFINRLKTKLGINKEIIDKSMYKIIFTAQNFEDNLIPLQLCKDLSKFNYKIISFCMAELGIFSRIMCVKSDAFMTYCSIEDTTAPGQINIRTMKEVYQYLFP